jgi:hypothetical protein
MSAIPIHSHSIISWLRNSLAYRDVYGRRVHNTVNDTVKHGISVQRLDRIQHIAKSNRLNVLRQRKCLVARVNDGQRLERQIMHRRAHRGCQRRRNRALHLEAKPQPSAHDE